MTLVRCYRHYRNRGMSFAAASRAAWRLTRYGF